MTARTGPSPQLQAAVAAHRFGLGEPRLHALADDPRGWLLAQIGPADAQRGEFLVAGLEGARRVLRLQAMQLMAPLPATATMVSPADGPAGMGVLPERPPPPGIAAASGFRAIAQADARARLLTASLTTRPFTERLALFWTNHFAVSVLKGPVRGLAGAYEREAIRPHVGGRFETLLKSAVTHAAMLRYLDNDQSAGPDSEIVRRLQRRARTADQPGPRITGLNENLAREILELHTLGAAGGGGAYGGWGGYTQADVTAFAAVLTGWRVPVRQLIEDDSLREGAAARFDPAWHQPGPKTVLGQRYPEGPEALDAVLADLARHPSTARFIAFKLSRHVVADAPPPALVARLARAYLDSDGDLPTLYRALVDAPEAWAATPAKLKTPEEFVVSSARLLQWGEAGFRRVPDGGVAGLGQRLHATPSPAGWPDRAEDWLGPDAVWKRVEWATRVAALAGRTMDARTLASDSLGPWLGEATTLQLQRAADGPQALALLLMAPEFQRR